MAFPSKAIAALLVSGLAGSVFTWWVSHPRPSVISYQVTTTTLGGVKGLIPDLRIKIGADEIETVHIHTIEFISQSGPYVETAESVIAFAPGARFYGQVVAEAPNPVHHIACQVIAPHIKCTAGPFTGKGERYRVSVASDQIKAPDAFLEGRGIEFGPWKFEGQTWADVLRRVIFAGVLIGFLFMVRDILSLYLLRRREAANRPND
jgi:hypothetical protein